MAEGDISWRYCVDKLKGYTIALETAPVPVAEMPDAAGAVRDIERRLAAIRHGWNDEQMEAAKDAEGEFGPPTFERTPYGTVSPKVVGTEFRTVTTRTAKRTYNTAPLLRGIAQGLTVRHGVETSEMDALRFVLRGGIASIDWKWRPLTVLARDLGLPMRVVPRPIADDGDLDGPWVGEDWREGVKQEAITPDGKEQA